MSKLTCIDLFCGMGGFSSGFKDIDVILGIDNNKYAIESFKANNPNAKTILDDIRNVKSSDLPSVDIIVGGFPCVSFSMAGKRESKDERGFLYQEFVRIVNDKKPLLFMFENVQGLLSAKTETGELVLDVIVRSFSELGYSLKECLINCADIGVCQKRKRVICFGVRNDFGNIKNFKFPIQTKQNYNSYSLLQPKEEVDNSFYHSQKMIDGFKKRKENNLKLNKGYGYQVLKENEPSYTISARYYKDGADCLVKYDENTFRKLTPLECARFQSYNDDYIIVGSNIEKYKQIGNAVPHLLSCRLNDCIKTFMECKNVEIITTKSDLHLLNVSQLKDYCKQNNIVGYSGKKKADLRKYIKTKILI